MGKTETLVKDARKERESTRNAGVDCDRIATWSVRVTGQRMSRIACMEK